MPDNYVEVPPSNIKAVRKNAKILTNLLNSDQSKTGLGTLIQSLKDLIYPKIESFIADAKIALAEQLQFDLTEGTFTLKELEDAFIEQKPNLPENLIEWIDEMLKDINYLNEMYELENPNYPEKDKVSLHIVPISGLVVGVICRLENECKTVCELWEPATYESSNGTALHAAVIAQDMDKVISIVASNLVYLNVQDSFGFTPLHYASTANTLSSIQVYFNFSLSITVFLTFFVI